MNPAALVILWIRLSVTFGYPATLTHIQTISKIFGDTPEYKDISHTLPLYSTSTSLRLSKSAQHSFKQDEGHSTVPYEDKLEQNNLKASPFYANYPSNLILNNIQESSTVSDIQDDTQIISIVRVSSTSVVKPKVIVNKSNEISISVSSNTTKKSEPEIRNKTFEKFENFVTPFVSLLRKNHLDVDEDVPKQSFKFSNYVPTYKKFPEFSFNPSTSFKPVINYFDNYSQITNNNKLDSLYRKSNSNLNDTNEEKTEQYVDVTDRILKKGKQLDYDDSYDEQEYAESERIYGETEKVYGEPEKTYGEPEKIYGEPEKTYGEPEKTYGEPEKTYGEPEKIYEESEKNYEESEKNFHKSEITHEEPLTEFEKHDDFKIPESSESSKPYSSYTTKINDKKSSYIVDNGTYRKYRVEEKTSDGFIVGEYGMVSHQDGSLRGVRYTADSNISPSIIYETLVKFLSLK